MSGAASTVFVVDRSWEFRMALAGILGTAGYSVRLFESADAFLAAQDAETPGCVLLDISLPGMSGLELQRLLLGSPCSRPVVFLTAEGDIQSSVRAMKAGAVDFLTKPIDDARLIGAIEQALQCDQVQREARELSSTIRMRLKTLTPRERQVMVLVIHGCINKQIAAMLGIGEKTVKAHRGSMMSKMGVRSVARLVQLGARSGVVADRKGVYGCVDDLILKASYPSITHGVFGVGLFNSFVHESTLRSTTDRRHVVPMFLSRNGTEAPVS